MFEATSFSSAVDVSRTTIKNYLNVLEVTNIVSVLKPFYTNKNKEIISISKVFGFDTGFISYFKGWESLRAEDRGYLWEHIVLNELLAYGLKPQYWRNKQKNEIDFVFNKNREVIAVECKWKDDAFKPDSLKVFRSNYRGGKNIVVAANIQKPYKKRYGDLEVHFLALNDLVRGLSF